MNSDLYSVAIHWSEDDGGFIATVPDLPGCSAFGLTRDAAAAEARDAIEAWVEAARAAGNQVPTPTKPPEPASYSGKVLVRMPSSLHRNMVREAEREGVSLNQFMVYVLTDGVARLVEDKSVRSNIQFVTPVTYSRIAHFVMTSPPEKVETTTSRCFRLEITGHA